MGLAFSADNPRPKRRFAAFHRLECEMPSHERDTCRRTINHKGPSKYRTADREATKDHLGSPWRLENHHADERRLRLGLLRPYRTAPGYHDAAKERRHHFDTSTTFLIDFAQPPTTRTLYFWSKKPHCRPATAVDTSHRTS